MNNPVIQATLLGCQSVTLNHSVLISTVFGTLATDTNVTKYIHLQTITY